ncbi:unnamed protein product [Enterobius vermicularis]|uniref:Pre-mRNA-processing factor 39 n=1 Tax=Enterobius vermicularis TaxID=51028 RepID=A0A0N4VC07_ENTVE|nr:unnamed protein product [Enterobius vermicularis]
MGRDDDSSSRSDSRSRSDSDEDGHSHGRRHERSRSRSHTRHRDRRSRSDSSDRESDALKQYWNVVKEDSRNFDGWTQLLQYVEHLDDTKAARKAYDAFFKRYPYCYGYWRKYAEFERRHKHYERAIEVYEKGVAAVGLSVDLWLHYLFYIQEIVQHQDNAAEKLRAIYERALKACGLDFRSDKLWKEYINFEQKNGELLRVSELYDLLLSTPTLLYNSHFEKYQIFVNSYEPDKIIKEEEYNEIFARVEANLKKTMDGELYLIEEYEDDTPPDIIPENGEEPPKKILRRRKHCEEALRALRHEIVEKRRKKYTQNEQEISLRWVFEENIKRPYFHVKPLERAQLRNWHAYLDFEVSRGNVERCTTLFERCLVACALYEEMWIKYARYLDSINEVQQARMVYRRATETHLPRNANLHLAYSAFEEKHGNPNALLFVILVIYEPVILSFRYVVKFEMKFLQMTQAASASDFEKAASILSEFDRRHPGYGVIALRRIGVERRLAQFQAGEGCGKAFRKVPDYSPVISRYERLIHDPHNPTKLTTFYALKLARFHARVRNDRKLAEKILKDAINRDKENPDLYLSLVDLVYTISPLNEAEVLSAFDFALSSELSEENKLRFSQRKLDFLEDLGSDVTKLQEHMEFHMKMQKAVESGGSTTKRRADSRNKGEILEKRPRTDPYATVAYSQSQQLQQYYIPTNNNVYSTPNQQQPALSGYYYSGQQAAVASIPQSAAVPVAQGSVSQVAQGNVPQMSQGSINAVTQVQHAGVQQVPQVGMAHMQHNRSF